MRNYEKIGEVDACESETLTRKAQKILKRKLK